jgi:cellobiose-specific phosphotransferase system component IIC
MSILIISSLVLLIASFIPCSGQELFRNPGMEDANIEAVYGHAWGYNMERVSQSHNGSFAVKLSGRYGIKE